MLLPDSSSPWIWTNDKWNHELPGTFVVIIGVSDYAHLDGSSKSFWMDKLFVSATTALRFFEWLASAYQWTDCPIAKCWLLLAPTPLELAAIPHMNRNARLPDFESCQDALLSWHKTMSELPAKAAKRSRSVF